MLLRFIFTLYTSVIGYTWSKPSKLCGSRGWGSVYMSVDTDLGEAVDDYCPWKNNSSGKIETGLIFVSLGLSLWKIR